MLCGVVCVVWCCVVLCGVVWCCVVLCGVVCCCVLLCVVVCCCVVVVVRTGWCGRGASRECLSSHVRACIKLKWVSASALTPSAGLTSRSKTLRPYPSESRFQAFPGAKTSPNSKSRKKIARHAGLTPHSFGGRGAQSFPSP